MPGNQAEGSIAVDPADPSHLFAATNIDHGDGLMAATSGDGGQTWATRIIANDTDGLPAACCDPSTAFDSFGNLFLTYVNANTNNVVVLLLSTDAGQSFSVLAQFQGNVDQPTVTTGPGQRLADVPEEQRDRRHRRGRHRPGRGRRVPAAPEDPRLDRRELRRHRRRPLGPGHGHLPGAAGRRPLQAVRQHRTPAAWPTPHFGKPRPRHHHRTCAAFDYIPAQPDRSVDAEAGLAFDRSGGPFNGRVYLVYTEETPGASGNTDILLRYSDNQGGTWSQPIRVNDDTTLNSQFNPRIAVDDTTGNVAVGWYDARDDAAPADRPTRTRLPNDDAGYFATLVTPQADGLVVSPNQMISAGVSNAFDANSDTDFGDYSGLDFAAGTHPPALVRQLQQHRRQPRRRAAGPERLHRRRPRRRLRRRPHVSLGGLACASGPLAALAAPTGKTNPGFVKRGSELRDHRQLLRRRRRRRRSLGGGNLLVTGPNGFAAPARLCAPRSAKGGAVLATYSVASPGGRWAAADDGTYTIRLQPARCSTAPASPPPPASWATSR